MVTTSRKQAERTYKAALQSWNIAARGTDEAAFFKADANHGHRD